MASKKIGWNNFCLFLRARGGEKHLFWYHKGADPVPQKLGILKLLPAGLYDRLRLRNSQMNDIFRPFSSNFVEKSKNRVDLDCFPMNNG
jgi:hypothetical protein